MSCRPSEAGDSRGRDAQAAASMERGCTAPQHRSQRQVTFSRAGSIWGLCGGNWENRRSAMRANADAISLDSIMEAADRGG